MLNVEVQVGMKLKCIDDRFKLTPEVPIRGNVVITWPERGNVYTIREVLWHRGQPGVRLSEVRNPSCLEYKPGDLEEPTFSLRRFERALS